MDRKTATIVGAAAALTASPALVGSSTVQAAPSPLVAASYSELLEPIPNAVERLRTYDAEAAARPARLIPAQYNRHHHHHHHHHNRHWYRTHGYSWLNGAWVLAPRPHHHHHHHHNN